MSSFRTFQWLTVFLCSTLITTACFDSGDEEEIAPLPPTSEGEVEIVAFKSEGLTRDQVFSKQTEPQGWKVSMANNPQAGGCQRQNLGLSDDLLMGRWGLKWINFCVEPMDLDIYTDLGLELTSGTQGALTCDLASRYRGFGANSQAAKVPINTKVIEVVKGRHYRLLLSGQNTRASLSFSVSNIVNAFGCAYLIDINARQPTKNGGSNFYNNSIVGASHDVQFGEKGRKELDQVLKLPNLSHILQERMNGMTVTLGTVYQYGQQKQGIVRK